MRVALVHDWLNGMRGGEKVLETLCERYPDADVFTLFYVAGTVSDTIARHRIITSSLQKLPFARTHYRRYLPLYPTAIEQFNLDAYDLVISSSHCAAKSIIAPGRARHLCYAIRRCATRGTSSMPTSDRSGLVRWRAGGSIDRCCSAWRGGTPRPRRALDASWRTLNTLLGGSADTIIARLRSCIHLLTRSFTTLTAHLPGRHFLIVSALVPYKRIDVAIEACRRVGATLRIAGDGPDRDRLEQLADGHVEFLGRLSDEQIRDEYRRACAVLLPGEEDFGIVRWKRRRAGAPSWHWLAAAHSKRFTPGETGILFDDFTPGSMATALDAVAVAQFDPERLRANAQRFSRERHVERMHAVIDETVDAPIGTRW
jgi:glycosyltransferase involved in cell wall biosynthesis